MDGAGLFPELRELGVSLLGQAAWVALGAVVAVTVRLLRAMGRHARLRRAFGENVRRAADVVIYLPMWRVRPAELTHKRFDKLNCDGGVSSYYGPDRTFAEDDLKSAFEAAGTFVKFFPNPIPIQPDDAPLQAEATSILIGAPLANRHVQQVLALYRHDAPEDLPVEFPALEENGDTKAAFLIRSNADGREFRYAEGHDYAVVMRLPKLEEGEGYHFICAGIDASGTAAAGLYLRRCWGRFAKQSGPAAAVLSLTRGQPETCRAQVFIHQRNGAWVARSGRNKSK
jgi:hypothetical protein